MASYIFQSTSYRNGRDMMLAVAEEYLSAGGANSRETMLEFLSDMTDEQMADEATREWNLTGETSDDDQSPPYYDRDELVWAFADVRADFVADE